MKHTLRYRIGLLFPALSWLFIQFAMTGVMLGSPTEAMQVTICSPLGVQEVTIDLATGEPVEPILDGSGCDWCQSFGLVTDGTERGDVNWVTMAHRYQHKLVLAPPPHKPLRFVADYNSRAPPVL